MRVNVAFREMDFGNWEGRSLKDVWNNDREAVERFYRAPDKESAPNGESMQAVLDRLLPAWQALLESHQNEHLLLINHGGTIRVLLSCLLQMPLSAVTRLDIPYASLSRVQVFKVEGQWFPKLLFLNRAINGGVKQ